MYRLKPSVRPIHRFLLLSCPYSHPIGLFFKSCLGFHLWSISNRFLGNCCCCLLLHRKIMACARNVSSLSCGSIDCDCKVQFLSCNLCHSCCICTLLVARVRKLLLLFVFPFFHAAAAHSWPQLSSLVITLLVLSAIDYSLIPVLRLTHF